MTKLYHLLAIVSIPLLLAGSGLVAYLAYAGRLSGPTLAAAAEALRGVGPKPAAAAQPLAPQPAAADPAVAGAARPSAESLNTARRAERLQRAVLERAASDVAARQALLDQSLQSLLKLQESVSQQQKSLTAARERQSADGRNDGFAREVEYVAKLSPKLAKEHVLRTFRSAKADAVRLFMALQPAQGQRILEQFRTPEEIDVMHDLLEQIRIQEAPSTPASGTTEDGPDESP